MKRSDQSAHARAATLTLMLLLLTATALNAQQLSKEYIYFGDRLLSVNAGGSSAPAAVSVTPSSGSGATQTSTYLFSDPDGVADLVSAQIAINNALGGALAVSQGRGGSKRYRALPPTTPKRRPGSKKEPGPCRSNDVRDVAMHQNKFSHSNA
jgi:hypothetical protein